MDNDGKVNINIERAEYLKSLLMLILLCDCWKTCERSVLGFPEIVLCS